MAAQVTTSFDPVHVPLACFNIGGHLFRIPVKQLASDYGRATKLWKAVEFNFDSNGMQVESELHFDRDYCAFSIIHDFLCGKELNIGSFAHNQLHLLREEASFFGIHHLVQLLDLQLASVGRNINTGESRKSEPSQHPLQPPQHPPHAHDDQSSESSSLSAQGSWHSNSSSSPAEVPSLAPRKRKIAEPSRAAKRCAALSRPPISRAIIFTSLAAPQSFPVEDAIVHVPLQAANTGSDSSTRKCQMCFVSQSSGRRPMLWRRGPNGPKTLCNNCGIKWYFQQKRAGLVGAPEKRGRKPFVAEDLAGSEEEDQLLAAAN